MTDEEAFEAWKARELSKLVSQGFGKAPVAALRAAFLAGRASGATPALGEEVSALIAEARERARHSRERYIRQLLIRLANALEARPSRNEPTKEEITIILEELLFPEPQGVGGIAHAAQVLFEEFCK